jgi:hypothetical protein
MSQDSWSRKSRPVTGIRPPASTSCSISETTSSGMICSLERAIDDSTRPRMADATQVAATVTNSSRLAFPSSSADCLGAPLPTSTMPVAIAASATANAQNTAILALR